MNKYFLFLFFIFSSILSANNQVSFITWDLNNKSLLILEPKIISNILNMDVDLVVLQNLKNRKELKSIYINKKLATTTKFKKNFLNLKNNLFLINRKTIKYYYLSKYNDILKKDFSISPIGLVFYKNDIKYLVINLYFPMEEMRKTYTNLAGLEYVVEYFSNKENIPEERIFVTGNFNIHMAYLDTLKYNKLKYLNKNNNIIIDNKLSYNYLNTIVSKNVDGFSNNILKDLNINTNTFKIEVSNIIPIKSKIIIPDVLPSIIKRNKMIKKYSEGLLR